MVGSLKAMISRIPSIILSAPSMLLRRSRKRNRIVLKRFSIKEIEELGLLDFLDCIIGESGAVLVEIEESDTSFPCVCVDGTPYDGRCRVRVKAKGGKRVTAVSLS